MCRSHSSLRRSTFSYTLKLHFKIITNYYSSVFSIQWLLYFCIEILSFTHFHTFTCRQQNTKPKTVERNSMMNCISSPRETVLLVLLLFIIHFKWTNVCITQSLSLLLNLMLWGQNFCFIKRNRICCILHYGLFVQSALARES